MAGSLFIYSVLISGVQYTLKYVTNVFVNEFTKIVRNEIIHVQGTTHNSVILFYNTLIGRCTSEHSS
jgi:hypothetical protein